MSDVGRLLVPGGMTVTEVAEACKGRGQDPQGQAKQPGTA